jgi:hypothetical protein
MEGYEPANVTEYGPGWTRRLRVDGRDVDEPKRQRPLTPEQQADLPRPDDADRYAIYRLRNGERERLVETSLQGVGMTLHALRFPENADEEPLLVEDDRVGIFDRRERRWTLNPWANN